MTGPLFVGIVLGVLAFAGFVATILANLYFRHFDQGDD